MIYKAYLAKFGIAEQELFKYLGEVRDRVRRYYFDVDLASGRLQSLVEEHYDELIQGVGDYLQRLSQERSAEAGQELARLTAQVKLDEQQRAARLVELRAQLAQWDQVGQWLEGLIRDLTGLEQALAQLA